MRRWILAALVSVMVATLVTPAPAAVILGGQLATEEYDFMVSVQRKGGDHFCGGSLVRKNWVLTAGHCADGEQPEGLQVMMGSHKLSEPGDVYEVKKVVVHPGYISNGTHDVALLQLSEKAAHKPIKIATPDQAELWAPGTAARVIGWGAEVFYVGPGSNDLKEVDIPVLDDDTCEQRYAAYFGGIDPDTEVCAGEDTGLKDSCQGDSGGPFMVPDSNGVLVQFGVVSWGLGCGFPMLPGVYAEVGQTELNDWVNENLPPIRAVKR